MPTRLWADIGGPGGLDATVTPVISLVAEIGGSGGTTATVLEFGTLTASIGGSGATGADAYVYHELAEAEAGVGGQGGLEAAVAEFLGLDGSVGGAGGLAADLVIEAEIGGAGSTHGDIGFDAAVGGLGGVASAVTPVYTATADIGGPGGVDATLTALSPMGMNKAGSMGFTSGTTGAVTGWSVRSGFPGTVIRADALLVNGSGRITVQCEVTLEDPFAGATPLVFEVMKNDAAISTDSIGPFAIDVTFSPVETTVVAGDRIWLRYSSPAVGSGAIEPGASNTYLYYTVDKTSSRA